ncbi:MAG TPA: hypothetical protein VK860_06150 [Ilumatobacteraceae bacterium]|nr:hypothetical protein [Ilumatobacteraceae bacterium]
MSRRIDIELTSALPDGSWTWRAAGARQPRGTVDASILPAGSSVGDVLKVEVEQMLEGIEVQSIVKGREKADDANVLELLPSDKPFEAVIETRAKRDRGGRDGERRGGRDGDRKGRGPKRDGRRDAGRGGDGRRDEGRGGEGADRDGKGRSPQRRQRPHFEAPPELPQRPKPKRLRPGKARRQAVLADLPEEQRPIAELALQGLSAVRSRVKEENTKLAAAGQPTMPEQSVVKMAEDLLPKLRVAEWLDRAEAAQRQMEHLDLRDLRSVVAAGEDPIVSRDESTRAVAEDLKQSLVRKQEEELTLWFGDIDAAVGVGRVIRALRLSSQPPKAGVMFPPDLARKLGEAATAALTPDDPADRWIAVLEAAAFSPVRTLVVPSAPPSVVTEELKATTVRLGPALPQIAALLGVEVPEGTPKPKPLRAGPPRKDARKSPAKGARRGDRKPPARPPEPVVEPTPEPTPEPSGDPTPTPVEDAPETPPTEDAPATEDAQGDTPPPTET